MAQLVEQLIRNQQVAGSNPASSSNESPSKSSILAVFEGLSNSLKTWFGAYLAFILVELNENTVKIKEDNLYRLLFFCTNGFSISCGVWALISTSFQRSPVTARNSKYPVEGVNGARF